MPLLTPRLREHPCFGGCAGGQFGRIHLPVAPKCNLQCLFCDRRYDCANESRPGVTSAILTPQAAVERAIRAVAAEPRIRVVGIAGPGDPLANEETMETLRLVKAHLPEAILCLSTNGLWLEEALEALLDLGVETLTVTVNSLRPETAAQLYSWVTGPSGRRLTGLEAGEYLVERQRRALERCREKACTLKINTVLLPSINGGEMGDIAAMAKRMGAAVMNVMPLIPCGAARHLPPPTTEELREARGRAAGHLPLLNHCRQCRADAVGIV